MELVVTTQLASQPEERLLKVVVGFRGDIVVLKILLAVESDLFGLHLTIFDFDLVSRQYNRDIFADTSQVTMPVGYVLVGDTRGHVEHNDGTLTLNVVAITESTEFLHSPNGNGKLLVQYETFKANIGACVHCRETQSSQFEARDDLTSWPAVSQTLNLMGPRLV